MEALSLVLRHRTISVGAGVSILYDSRQAATGAVGVVHSLRTVASRFVTTRFLGHPQFFDYIVEGPSRVKDCASSSAIGNFLCCQWALEKVFSRFLLRWLTPVFFVF